MSPLQEQLKTLVDQNTLGGVVDALIHISHDKADSTPPGPMSDCWRRCAQSLDRAHQQIGATVL